jgi:lysylphosphatidylglycerol synthase-like protein
MSLRLKLPLFLLGLAIVVWLIAHVGLEPLLEHLQRAGWVLPVVVAFWAGAYACNTSAWLALLPRTSPRPGWLRAYAIAVTSFALNYLTPALGVGGEAYRGVAVAPWLGSRGAIGSVVQYRLLHSLAHMAFVVSALVPALWLLPGTPMALGVLAFSAVLGVAVGWFLFRRHREGLLEAGLDLVLAIPGVKRAARRLEPRRSMLRELDGRITEVYHRDRRRFWWALVLEYLSRYVMALELLAIIWVLGLGFRPGAAMVAAALSSTIANLFFFLPMELGAREGGIYLMFVLLGFGPEHGVFAAVVTRLRELVWMLLGLGLLWVRGGYADASTGRALS